MLIALKGHLFVKLATNQLSQELVASRKRPRGNHSLLNSPPFGLKRPERRHAKRGRILLATLGFRVRRRRHSQMALLRGSASASLLSAKCRSAMRREREKDSGAKLRKGGAERFRVVPLEIEVRTTPYTLADDSWLSPLRPLPSSDPVPCPSRALRGGDAAWESVHDGDAPRVRGSCAISRGEEPEPEAVGVHFGAVRPPGASLLAF